MYKKYVKRGLDIIISICCFPIFAVVFVIVGLAIKLDDQGPIFYTALRLGKDGRCFRMYKFRSMKVEAPDIFNRDGSTYNSEDDPRLTKVGRILRKTSIDEIPQIINVIKNDMSIIGPRPDLPEQIKLYVGDEVLKLKVKPGITGFNQAFFRNSIPTHERFKNDVYYVQNLGFWLDLKIFFKTIKTVFEHNNIYISKTEK